MRVEFNQNSPYFGTYLGLKMQDKVLLAKQRNMFSAEQLNNLERIENDGLDAVLEIVNKYKILRKNDKGIVLDNECLTISNGRNNRTISSMKDIIVPTYDKKKRYFHMNKFVKLFNDDFKLFEKIQDGFKNL